MPILSDRIKRGAILVSTALLPYTPRVRARYAMLHRLEHGKAKRSNLFVIGHPKSGNTWLRTMLSHAYRAKSNLPESLVLKTDELALADARIPRFCVTNGHYSYERAIAEGFGDDPAQSIYADRKVLFLTRHPCDIATSWYLQFTKRISSPKRELINSELDPRIDHETISRWDFVIDTPIGLASIIDFLNYWEKTVTQLDHHLVIHYEELRTDTQKTLERIVAFFELDLSSDEIAQAVEFGSFENLKKLEASGFFQRGGMKLQNPDDPSTFKVRRGKIQGFREDFTPEQVAEMDALVASRLSPTLGYTKTSPEVPDSGASA